MLKYLTSVFFGLRDAAGFVAGINQALANLRTQAGAFTGDNVFTYGKNLSFLTDEAFMRAFKTHASTEIEKAIIWRMAVVAWGARNGMRLEGDLVECACYKGTTARIVADYIELKDRPDRKYYLYDLFEHDPAMQHHSMPNMAISY